MTERPGGAPFINGLPQSVIDRYEATQKTASKTVDVYHRTSPEAADSIMASKRFEPEDEVTYVLKADFGHGYGDSRIHLRVPQHLVHEDEDYSTYHDGEAVEDADKYWFVRNADLKPEHIVGRQDTYDAPQAR